MGGLCDRDVPSVAIVCYSRGCSGRLSIFVLSLSSEIYLNVSDTAQKYARDSLHPIRRLLGTKMSDLSVFISWDNYGRT